MVDGIYYECNFLNLFWFFFKLLFCPTVFVAFYVLKIKPLISQSINQSVNQLLKSLDDILLCQLIKVIGLEKILQVMFLIVVKQNKVATLSL